MANVKKPLSEQKKKYVRCKRSCNFYFRINKVGYDQMMSLMGFPFARFLCYRQVEVELVKPVIVGDKVMYHSVDGTYINDPSPQKIAIVEGYLNLRHTHQCSLPVMMSYFFEQNFSSVDNPFHIQYVAHAGVKGSKSMHELCNYTDTVQVGEKPRIKVDILLETPSLITLN